MVEMSIGNRKFGDAEADKERKVEAINHPESLIWYGKWHRVHLRDIPAITYIF